MAPIIVLISGIDHDLDIDDQGHFLARDKIFARYFPDAVIKLFDCCKQEDLIDESCLHRKAEQVLDQLHNLRAEPSEEFQYLIFVGHNIGASLIKLMLFLASDHEKYYWIYWGTLALYLIECPAYLSCYKWERFLADLLITRSLRSAKLPEIVNFLPKALVLIEWQFAAINGLFHVNVINSETENETFNHDSDPWNFQGDVARIDEVLMAISEDIGQFKPSLRSGLRDFQKLLTNPDTSMSRVGVTGVQEFHRRLPDDHMNLTLKSWSKRSGSSVLEITGKAGSGKAHLCSYILHRKLIEEPRARQACVSYDFSRPGIHSTSEWSLFASLVRQILAQRPSYWKYIQRQYTFVSSSYIRTLLSKQIWKTFVYLLSLEPEGSQIVIVLNAVDECRVPVARKIARLTTTSGLRASLKVLMTSSSKGLVSPAVYPHRIELEGTGYENVIGAIARRRIENIVLKRPVWKDSTEAILTNVCSGRFTYLSAMMNLDVLEKKNLPSTKEALGSHLMTPIMSLELSIRTLTLKLRECHQKREAVNWIYHSIRPLNTSELSVALALSPNGIDEASPTSLTLESLRQGVSWDVLRDLHGLVGGIIELTEWSVLLIHRRIRQSMSQEKDILFTEFDATIVRRCLLYLGVALQAVKGESMTASDSKNSETRDPIPVTALLNYAQHYWTEHYRRQAVVSDTIDDEVLRFLTENSDTARSWSTSYASLHGWLPETKESPLLVTTQLGFDRLVFKILEADPRDLRSKLRDAARVAAHAGHAKLLVKLLGKAGVDKVDVLPALRAAATSGQASAIDILSDYIQRHAALARLEAAKSAVDMNPVILAASQGHTLVVEKLLSLYGSFSIITEDGRAPTAVHLAAANGDLEMLQVLHRLRKDEFYRILLPKQTDSPDKINPLGDVERSGHSVKPEQNELENPDFWTLTPVQIACNSGNVEVFDFLRNMLQERFSQVKNDSSKLLGLAVRAGSLDIVEKLLQDEVDLQNWVLEGTFLQDAAQIGHFEILCRLYEKLSKLNKMQTDQLAMDPKAYLDGSDEDMASKVHFTLCVDNALNKACLNGHVEIVHFLLKMTRRRKQSGMGLLVPAAKSGRLDILKALMTYGYKVQDPGSRYNEIMNLSIDNNNAHIVRLLVAEGVGSQWDGRESSIHFASRLNRSLCLRELLRTQNESEIKKLSRGGNSALDEAAKHGSVDTLGVLLDWEKNQATIRTPRISKTLECALEYPWTGKITVIRLLLENGWESDRTDTTDENCALHVAARTFNDDDPNCQDIFKLLLDQKENTRVDVVNRHGETPLFVACQKGHVGLVNLLLARSADQTLANKEKRTPLHVALQEKRQNVVRALLGVEQGEQRHSKVFRNAPVEATDQDGLKAIHLAYWSYDVMDALLSYNPKPDVDAFTLDGLKRTALMDAASDAPFCVVMLLLKHGAQVNLKDSSGWAPLDHTMERNIDFGDTNEVAKQLRAHGADVNSSESGCTALYLAIRHEKDDVASSLLDAIVEDGHTLSEAASPNIFGGSYHSPLQLAVFRERTELVIKLLDRGAQICAQGGAFGSPLHAAMWNDSPELAKLLLERCILQKKEIPGVSENQVSDCISCKACGTLEARPMGTPLHALCSRPQDRAWPTKDIASLLVEHGADVDARDYSGRSALMLLALHRNDDHDGAVALIQDLKADPNLKDGVGKTALHYAVPSATIEFVHVLLAAGADVQALDGLGQTVLSRAASRNEVDVFNTVLGMIPKDWRSDQMSDALIPALKSDDCVKAAFHAIIDYEGVALSRRDRSGWTAMDVATSMGLHKEAEILKDRGAQAGEAILRPSKLSSVDKEPIVCVSDDGREAWMEEFDVYWPPRKIVGIVRADHCIPFATELYYFEVTVQSLDPEGAIAIGLVEGETTLRSLVGLEPASWGFHSDDGSIIVENEVKHNGSTFTDGQTVGITVHSQGGKMKMFFTLDGKRVEESDYTVSGQLFPAVSFLQGQTGPCKARINFGSQNGGEEFIYKPFGGLREELPEELAVPRKPIDEVSYGHQKDLEEVSDLEQRLETLEPEDTEKAAQQNSRLSVTSSGFAPAVTEDMISKLNLLQGRVFDAFVLAEFPENPNVKKNIVPSDIARLVDELTISSILFPQHSHAQSMIRGDHVFKDLCDFILKSPKLFLICVCIGLRPDGLNKTMRAFKQYMITDDHLPINETTSQLVFPRNRLFKQLFIDYQSMFLGRILPATSRFSSIAMGPEEIFPFKSVSLIADGEFGTVWKAVIHGSFLSPKTHKDYEFALKRFKQVFGESTPKAWEREVTALKAISGRGLRHVIRINAIINRGAERFLLFPWADGGNLIDYWRHNDTFDRRRGIARNLVPEIIRQLLGLAEALLTIHEFPYQDGRGVYRHGDLKPENILIFEGRVRCGTWTIADLGLAQFHENTTHAREVMNFATTTAGWGTVSYQPPETARQLWAARHNRSIPPTSRLYDIWSMGCIILQLIVWLIYGMKEIRNLTERTRQFQQDTGTFYTAMETSVQGSPDLQVSVHHEVKKLMEQMREHLKGSLVLLQLLEVVQNGLLVIPLPKDSTLGEAGCRMTARGLRSSLQKIADECERNPESWSATEDLVRQSTQENPAGGMIRVREAS